MTRRVGAADDAVSDDLEALTRADAATKAPGVAQVSRSFLVIFLLYGLVVPLVIGLFFLIVTLQKARTLALLRPSARSSTLVRGLLTQVLVVVGLGVAIGTLLFLPLSSSASDRSRSVRRADGDRLGNRHTAARRRQLLVLGPPRPAHRTGRSARRRRSGHVKLALREMRRRPGRFATATVLLTLIAVLLMLLGGLLDGLILRSTGAIRAQRADLVVFSRPPRSPSCAAASRPKYARRWPRCRASPAWAASASPSSGPLPGNGPRDLTDIALFGYEVPPDGVPAPPKPGEAYADSILQDDGVARATPSASDPGRSP